MIVALKDTVKDSKINDWFNIRQDGKTFEESINFDGLIKNLQDANYDNATADVWIDTGLRYIRNVRLDTSDKKTGEVSTLDFMLDYTGGDDFPFSIILNGNDSSGDNFGSINFGMSINQKSYVIKLTTTVDATVDKQKVQGSTELTITPSDEKVSVDKPAGATNILDLIGLYTSQIQSLQSQLRGATGLGSGIEPPFIQDDFQSQ